MGNTLSSYYVPYPVVCVGHTKEKKKEFLPSSCLQSNWEMNQGLHCSVLGMVLEHRGGTSKTDWGIQESFQDEIATDLVFER